MKIGISYIHWHREPAKLMKFIEKTGLKYWEVVLSSKNMEEERRAIEEIEASANLKLTFHAPFADLNPACLSPELRDRSIKTIKRAIEITSCFSDILVLHPGHLKPHGFCFPERAWEINVKSFQEIGKYADDHGVKLLLENMPDLKHTMCKSYEEVESMIHASGIDGGIVFDVGHANTTGNVKKFLMNLDSVSHIHLHDNDGKRDLHEPLGKGSVRWKEILPEISKLEDVVCILEIRNFRDGLRSLRYLEESGFIDVNVRKRFFMF